MTMFNITDGKNNISRDKPAEHIDLVILASTCLPALAGHSLDTGVGVLG